MSCLSIKYLFVLLGLAILCGLFLRLGLGYSFCLLFLNHLYFSSQVTLKLSQSATGCLL